MTIVATLPPVKGKKNKPAVKVVPFTAPATEVSLGDEFIVKVDELWLDKDNDRIHERINPEAIDQLAQSIARFGLQQAIQVTRFGAPAGKRRVVFGHRRLMAVKRIGALDVAAVPAEYTSEEQISEARATENLQRQDLHFMEEALAVSRLLDTYAGRHPPGATTYQDATPEDKREAVIRVAARLAKPEQWVRDRAFLARLDGKSRELVLDGKLPLGHAREIAKLADPRSRDELAQRAAAGYRRSYGGPREEPMPIADVREEVSKGLFSLSQVPWVMDKPFAGCPACADCPSNSANAPGLFEHGTRFSRDRTESRRAHGGQGTTEPSAGVCTNHVCFGKKNAAAGQAVARAATAAARMIREAKPKEREQVRRGAVAAVTPEFLQRSVVKHKFESRQRAGKPAKASTLSSYNKPPSAAEVAKDKFRNARKDWVKKRLEPALAKLFKLNPGLWALFCLMKQTKIYEATDHYDDKKSGRARDSAEMAKLLGLLKVRSWESIEQIEKLCGTQYGLADEWDWSRNGMGEKIVAAYGDLIDVPPAPKLEDFLPKGGKAEPAETPRTGSAEKRANAGKSKPMVDDGEGDGE